MAYLNVRVTPGARADALLGWQGDVLRMSVRAAPERGRANTAVCRLLARQLGVPASNVTLVRGAASRDKLLFVDGLNEDEVRRRLTA
ncbi:MAG: DUF167 domain-containing protein [Chloroflexi bacterium]|nr:DUF167 domain-containing protein [Chloroflexota bacterium]